MALRQRPRGRAITTALALAPSAFGGVTTPYGPSANPTVALDGLESVASFLHSRNGSLTNGHALVELGAGVTVERISWDLTITRIDSVTLFSDVGMGLLDLNGLPIIRLPFDAPTLSLGGTDTRYDDNGATLWTQRVTGSFDLTRFWIREEGRFADLSVQTNDEGLVYLEVFEFWDDDDDYGTTAGDTPLNPDASISGVITFHLAVPAPGASLAVAGAGLVLTPRRGRPSRT